MIECLIFTTQEEMARCLEHLLRDFPNTSFSRTGTTDCPYQIGVDLHLIDDPTFFGWAWDNGYLCHCFSLVMKLLEHPQPEWIRRHLARVAIDEIRRREEAQY